MNNQKIKQKTEELEKRVTWRLAKVAYVLVATVIMFTSFSLGMEEIGRCRRTHSVQPSTRMVTRAQERRIADGDVCNVMLESTFVYIGLGIIAGGMVMVYQYPFKLLMFYILVGKK